MSTGLPPTASSGNQPSTGSNPGQGTYFCLRCGAQLSIRERDRMPACPRCGGSEFRLDSIFASMQDHGETTAEFAATVDHGPPEWLAELRPELRRGSRHLVYRDAGGEIADFEIVRGWTRIGRSHSADIRLDDPSVSRRHALVVSEPAQPLRVLDDRSLNGVLINGEATEWGKLESGDELTIGSFRLFALDA
jgi:FHA domain/Zinc-ribbon containing domain